MRFTTLNRVAGGMHCGQPAGVPLVDTHSTLGAKVRDECVDANSVPQLRPAGGLEVLCFA
ncbi:MAG: hypothetical protein DWI67_07185 [Chloroflexi bacterium]|nr:MAG: hypothetical protein DWI67_07185 [Chloroflexota bacterium]